jgi:hypothetical protein
MIDEQNKEDAVGSNFEPEIELELESGSSEALRRKGG